MSESDDPVDLTRLILEGPKQLANTLTSEEIAGLTCTSTSMALAMSSMAAAAAASDAEALTTSPVSARVAPIAPLQTADSALNHAGDSFVYAVAAAARAAPARLERRLPQCRWLPQNTPVSVSDTTSATSSDTVALASYPRSGNSMLRGLLERRYGIYTGSDTRPDRTLSR